ncbi:MAG: hypothetical protein UHS41_04005 [Lachnospiraceae bacterium]|nr:hypothetical protein [Lachnospiraceae bacterium]
MTMIQRISGDMTWEQMLKLNSQETLLMLCQRLKLEEVWQDSMMELSAFLEKYLIEYPEKILLLLSKEDLNILFQIWGKGNSLDFSYMDQRNLASLEKLGFIRYSHSYKTITVNEEAKNNFYFYLKSKSARKKIQFYQDLEYAVKGILYQCGIIEFPQLCDILLKGGEDISQSMMLEFLIGRMELWSFLGILKNTKTQVTYLESCEVKEREYVFRGWLNNGERPFHRISVDEATLIGKMNGIGNWKGTKEMLRLGLTKVFGDVLPATVFVKTILLYIQNGDTMEELEKKLKSKTSDFSEEEITQFREYLNDMYWHTPLFYFKGYTRWEIEQEEHKFSVIDGGKKD